MGIAGLKGGGIHETIVNLEMSGFLYVSMINLTHTPTQRAVANGSLWERCSDQWESSVQSYSSKTSSLETQGICCK